MSGRYAVVVSCEHAGNDVPRSHRHLFESAAGRAALASDRGWDPGSLEAGEAFARRLGAPLVTQRVTRLLVECNRSLEHRSLFSEFSRRLAEEERAEVIERYWRSHRRAVRGLIDEVPPDRVVLHVGVHTFTPVLNGRIRSTEVGLLYDPRRIAESELVRAWRGELVGATWGWTILAGAARVASRSSSGPSATGLRVHRNRPYRGWTDGLTTTLRGELPPSRYLGIELEISQQLGSEVGWIGTACASALVSVLEQGGRGGVA